MNLILLGAIVMANLTVSAFFLSFWRSTRDRFFLFFSAAFLIEACGRLALGIFEYPTETQPLIYLSRLVAFSLILFAIIDKNYFNAQK